MKNKINVDPKAKALIFDCDGTLVDSMPLHMKAWEEAVIDSGLPFDYDFFFSRKGIPSRQIMSEYCSQNSFDVDVEKVIDEKNNIYRSGLNSVGPLEPVVAIALKYKDILPMAVVSGERKINVHDSLTNIGIIDLFSIIITSDDPFKPKPAPDKFLEAARLLNIKPEFCQVFEDGDSGIEAAIKANMIITDVRPYLENN
ncbi:MAG: HAD family phosphatase [Melioribacteraceae bacterium]